MAVNCRERGARYATAFVLCLVLVSTVAAPIITATAASQHQRHEQNQTHVQKQSQRHTLVIIHVSGSPSWSITASGSIQLDTTTTENTDSIGGKTADGSVGGLPWEDNASDPRDVIYYTGELLQFDLGGTGTARITLDGKRVNPQSLKNTPTPTATPTPSPTVTATPTTRQSTATQTPALNTPMTSPSTPSSPQSSRQTGTSTPSADDRNGLDWLPSNLVIVLVAVVILGVLFLQRG
jgi:hypothetical protein